MSTIGYKVSGQKMKSRFGMSHSAMRDAVKKGFLAGADETRAYGRDPSMTRKEWTRRQRWSLRQLHTHEKSLPVFDMDGSYYHESTHGYFDEVNK